MKYPILMSVLLFWMYHCPGVKAIPHYPIVPQGQLRTSSLTLQSLFHYQNGTLDEFLSSKTYSDYLLVKNKDPNNPSTIIERKLTKEEKGDPEFEKKYGAVYLFKCCCDLYYIGFMSNASKSPATTFIMNANALWKKHDHKGCGDCRLHFGDCGHHQIPGSLRKVFLCERSIVKDCKFLIRFHFYNDVMTLQNEDTTHKFTRSALDVVEDFFRNEYQLPSTTVQSRGDFVVHRKIQDPNDSLNFNWVDFLMKFRVSGQPTMFVKNVSSKGTYSPAENDVNSRRVAATRELYKNRNEFVHQDWIVLVERYLRISKYSPGLKSQPNDKPAKSKNPSQILWLIKYIFSIKKIPITMTIIKEHIQTNFPHLEMKYLEIFITGHLLNEITNKTITASSTKLPLSSTLTLLNHIDVTTKLDISNASIGFPQQSTLSSTNPSSSDATKPPNKRFKMPSTQFLVMEAIEEIGGTEGCSLVEIEKYISEKYPAIILNNLVPSVANWLENAQDEIVSHHNNGETTYTDNIFQ